MRNLVYAVSRDANGDRTARVYHGFPAAIGEEFPPNHTVEHVIPLLIHGKTYEARKSCFRDVVLDLSCSNYPGLSWGELAELQSWISANASRFGMRRELVENGLI